jgi:hypothetical protein
VHCVTDLHCVTTACVTNSPSTSADPQRSIVTTISAELQAIDSRSKSRTLSPQSTRHRRVTTATVDFSDYNRLARQPRSYDNGWPSSPNIFFLFTRQ